MALNQSDYYEEYYEDYLDNCTSASTLPLAQVIRAIKPNLEGRILFKPFYTRSNKRTAINQNFIRFVEC